MPSNHCHSVRLIFFSHPEATSSMASEHHFPRRRKVKLHFHKSWHCKVSFLFHKASSKGRDCHILKQFQWPSAVQSVLGFSHAHLQTVFLAFSLEDMSVGAPAVFPHPCLAIASGRVLPLQQESKVVLRRSCCMLTSLSCSPGGSSYKTLHQDSSFELPSRNLSISVKLHRWPSQATHLGLSYRPLPLSFSMLNAHSQPWVMEEGGDSPWSQTWIPAG